MSEWWVILSIIAAATAAAALVFKIGRRVGSVDAERDKFRAFAQEVRGDIRQILERLPPVTVAGSSPIELPALERGASKELPAPGPAGHMRDTAKAHPHHAGPH